MATDRKELLAKLTLITPALASWGLMPSMLDFCFTGDTAVAYKESIGLSVDLKTSFHGCVRGTVLLGMLGASGARDVEFEETEDLLNIKAGRTRLELALRPVDNFLFKMPNERAGNGITLTKQLLHAIKFCIEAVGTNSAEPEYLGVNLIPSGEQILLYGTDGLRLHHTVVKGHLHRPIIMHTQFATQLVRLVNGEGTQLSIDKHHMLYVGKGFKLYGPMLTSERPFGWEPLDLAAILKKLSPSAEKVGPMPKFLSRILQRAALMTERVTRPGITQVTIKDGIASFRTKTELGEMNDQVQVSQGDATVSFEAKVLLKDLPFFDQAYFGPECIALKRGKDLGFIAPKIKRR
jgi:hypothetical protein